MAKRKNKSEPELIIEESFDEKTGIKTIINRRGILGDQTRILKGPISHNMMKEFFGVGRKTIRQEFEENQEAVRAYLEAKGIPSGRTPCFVSIKDEPFRPMMDSDMVESLSKHTPYKLRRWTSLAKEKTEALSIDSAYVDYLLWVELLLNKFDDSKLGLIVNFASAYYRLRLLETNINRLASEQLRAVKRDKESGKKSGEAHSADTDEKWRKLALKLAISLREQKPELSQSGLATEIQGCWKADPTMLPAHDRLVKFIRQNEFSGALPRRKKDR